MRPVVWFYLFLALLVGIGPFFKGDALVLCMEKDGSVAIESLASTDTEMRFEAASASDSLCAETSDPCPNCHDTFIGPAHSNPPGLQSVSAAYLPDLTQLQPLDPIPLQPLSRLAPVSPPDSWRLTSLLAVSAPPMHLPSTLLLI